MSRDEFLALEAAAGEKAPAFDFSTVPVPVKLG